MKIPFDVLKFEGLAKSAGIDLVLACSPHDVRYLTGGYRFHFHAKAPQAGSSRYLPFVGVPSGGAADAFYVGRNEERGQFELEKPWIPAFVEAERGTVPAARAAAGTIRRLGLASATIGVELPFLPADAYLALREELPEASFVDATPLLEELRAVKSAAELDLLRAAYDRQAAAIGAAFAASRPGCTTAEVARSVETEAVARNLEFLFALVCAGPGFLRAPSAARWETGRILHVDAGSALDDYVADICRMGCMGEPSPLARDLHAACLQVQEEVRAAVRPGATCRRVLETGLSATRESPFAEYSRFVVHGIGMVPHEPPRFLPPNDRPLKAGMVLSIETDFLHPEVGHVKIEDAVIVVPGGCECLGDAGRDWHVVEPGRI